MEIRAFDRLEERVEKLIEFKDKYGLYFDKESCREDYTPKLCRYTDSVGTKHGFSNVEVEAMTNMPFETALYYAALVDSVMDYVSTGYAQNISKKEYLKENLPLAIFCAERVAGQCAKNLQQNKVSMFDFDDLSRKLLDDLVTLEARGVNGLHVTYQMKDKMTDIMRKPAFLVILNKELVKKNIQITSGDYIDKKGHFSDKERISKMLRVNLKERTK